MKTTDLRTKLSVFQRVEFICRPTPFRKMIRLSEFLGGPEIFIKRDDLTGSAFGGNKSRKLEWIIADAIKKHADTILTWGSIQSNWCLQTAAAARIFGITPVLNLFRTSRHPIDNDGNLLLDRLMGAEIHVHEGEAGKVVDMSQVADILDSEVDTLRKQGKHPYIAPIGGSLPGGDMELPLGAFGYMEAFCEIVEQAETEGLEFDTVIHASGSGGTQAGLIMGARILRHPARIYGISVSEEKKFFTRDIDTICRGISRAFSEGIDFSREDIIVLDEYIGEGYGVIDKEIVTALQTTAVEEGIFIDPVYTGKAMAALIDMIRKGKLTKDNRVVFVHTGGTPALFPYRDDIVKHLGDS